MTNMIMSYFAGLKEQYKDKANIWTFISALVIFVADYVLWKLLLDDPETFIYLPIQIYPVQLLAIVLGVNTVLAIVSYPKEKEISYLLHIGSIIAALLILALELFYITQLYTS